jgi:hypothetical protein
VVRAAVRVAAPLAFSSASERASAAKTNEEELQELQELAKLAERQAPEGMHTTDAVASNQVPHPHTPRHSLPLGAP